MFCNPSCKGTKFEGKNVSNAWLAEMMKNSTLSKSEMLSTARFLRKEIGIGKSVLKNDFYYKLKRNYVTRRKKQGAISGCLEGPQ